MIFELMVPRARLHFNLVIFKKNLSLSAGPCGAIISSLMGLLCLSQNGDFFLRSWNWLRLSKKIKSWLSSLLG